MRLDPTKSREDLTEVATRFREALEEALKGLSYTPAPLTRFPAGSCGFTSEMLGQMLNDHLNNQVMYVWGQEKDGERSHAWLRYGDIVLDVTGDQFACRPRVFVGLADSWFDMWAVDEPSAPAEFQCGFDNVVDRIYEEVDATVFDSSAWKGGAPSNCGPDQEIS